MNGPAKSHRGRWTVRLLIALAALLLLIAAIGPEVRDPSLIVDFERQNQPPSAAYPLGTDPLGRDNASRIADGVRTSVVVGLAAATLWAVLCIVLGLAGRALRRLSRKRAVDIVLDIVIVAAALGIAIPLLLDGLDPDAGWFQQAGATSSAGYERLVLSLTLYEPSVVLFIGLGIALGIWISRTSLPVAGQLRLGLIGTLVLAALAIRAEPYLAYASVSPVKFPSATIGTLIDQTATYSSTGWWMRASLATLWVAIMTAFLGGAVALGSRHVSMPANRSPRVPIYLVAAAWFIALNGIIWRLIARPIDEWVYWMATELAGAGLLGCAALIRRSWHDRPARMLYLAGVAFAVPLTLDWPLAKLLNFAIPRLLS